MRAPGWLRAPRRTIRLRLTVLFGALFLAAGAALLGVTYVLVAREFTANGASFFVVAGGSHGFSSGSGEVSVSVQTTLPTPALLNPADPPTPTQLRAVAHRQSSAALHQLLIDSAIALGLMALISIWLGWVVAGRVLRPLRTITAAARDISASSLHRRLALAGPDDELKQLGNTFDELLGRLETSFEAQRQFVANASHELRTPLTLERALVEVALADPDPSVESLRRTCEQVLAAGADQERLIEALLTLSRSQRGLDRHETVDLAAAAEAALGAVRCGDLSLETRLGPAWTSGDPALVERLAVNLLSNAVRHNRPGGEVAVATETRDGRAILTVTNTGPVVPAGEIARLFQPFQRLDAARTGDAGGAGLGLSIVHAIADAHRAILDPRPRPGGGLVFAVVFPGMPGPVAAA